MLSLSVSTGRYAPKVPSLPENNARQGFFERAEFEAVLEKLPEDLRDFALFAYLTGWRRGEIAGLRWENVDRTGGEIRLPDSKNGQGRVLPLDGELLALIARRWETREYEGFRGERCISPFVFHRLGVPPGQLQQALEEGLPRCWLSDQALPRFPANRRP